MLSQSAEGSWLRFQQPLPHIPLSFKERGQGVRFRLWRIKKKWPSDWYNTDFGHIRSFRLAPRPPQAGGLSKTPPRELRALLLQIGITQRLFHEASG